MALTYYKEMTNLAVPSVVPRLLGETCFNTPASYLLPRSCHVDSRPLSCLQGDLTLVNQKYGKQNYISSCPCYSKNLFENPINRMLLILLHQM